MGAFVWTQQVNSKDTAEGLRAEWAVEGIFIPHQNGTRWFLPHTIQVIDVEPVQ
jgi:hypothetical protein